MQAMHQRRFVHFLAFDSVVINVLSPSGSICSAWRNAPIIAYIFFPLHLESACAQCVQQYLEMCFEFCLSAALGANQLLIRNTNRFLSLLMLFF